METNHPRLAGETSPFTTTAHYYTIRGSGNRGKGYRSDYPSKKLVLAGPFTNHGALLHHPRCGNRGKGYRSDYTSKKLILAELKARHLKINYTKKINVVFRLLKINAWTTSKPFRGLKLIKVIFKKK